MSEKAAPPPYPDPSGGYPAQQPYPGQQQPYPGQPQQPYPGQPQQPYSGQPQAYPPPGAYPQTGQPQPVGAHATTTTVVVGGPIMGASYGPHPARMRCPHCQADITTTVDYEIGALVWIVVGVLFGLGFLVLITWFFCCVPCCINSLKDARHSCPNCHQHLGHYRRM